MVQGLFSFFFCWKSYFFLVLIFVRIRSSPSLETRVPPTTINPHCCGRASSFGGPAGRHWTVCCPWGKKALTFSLNSPRPYGDTLSIRIPGLRPSKTIHTFSHDLTTTHPGRGRVLPYMGYIGKYRSEAVWLSSSLLWDRVYKSESLGLEKGIIFHLN